MPINRASVNDLSDVRPDTGDNPDVSPTQLPIRGEKRIIPTPINPAFVSEQFNNAWNKSGQKSPQQRGFSPGRTSLVEASDFQVKAALEPFVDYVVVRLPHRGIPASGKPNGDNYAVYRFLINPSQANIQRTTLDGQAMTRAGWQIGVWGEDMVQITLSGKTAGQYFAFGTTDKYEEFTASYRNLQQLQMVFENNGYWFEGEQAGEGPLAADFTRRRIKMHEDVELIVGNFIWYGMFDSLTIQQTADTPFLMSFNISFTAWKERYRTGSPYDNQIKNDVQRGHSYKLWSAATISGTHGVPSNAYTPSNYLPPTQQEPPPESPSTPPSVLVADNDYQLLSGIDSTAADFSPMTNVLFRGNYLNYWNGIK